MLFLIRKYQKLGRQSVMRESSNQLSAEINSSLKTLPVALNRNFETDNSNNYNFESGKYFVSIVRSFN